MPKILSVMLALVLFGDSVLAAETNGAGTNAVGNVSTNQNPASMTDPELQRQAKGLLRSILGFWIMVLVGVLALASVAIRGAYKKDGMRGVAIVVAILILGAWMFGELMLSF
jgi:hypothetical protein